MLWELIRIKRYQFVIFKNIITVTPEIYLSIWFDMNKGVIVPWH